MRYLFHFFLGSLCGVFAQNPLHHQMLSAQGTSGELSNGLYVSQTIGQQSVIGNYTVDGKTYGQGFQQSLWSKYISSSVNNTITTVTYPNPFVNTIHFQFSEALKAPLTITLFDVNGRMVYTNTLPVLNQEVSFDLSILAAASYLVQLSSSNYSYYTQIFKQK